MTAAAALIDQVIDCGADLRIDGGDILCSAQHPLPEDLLVSLRTHKPALMRYLTGGRDRLELGELPVEWSEGIAALDAEDPPGDWPAREWARQLQVIKLFHERWSATAKALGWHALDLFGCHRIAPYRRLDHAGMCLLNWPDRVVLMLPNAAVMRRDESRLVYRRKPLKPDAVAVWDV